MLDVMNLLFSQEFLFRALIVGVLISLCTALLGVSLVLKRFSMIGDGLSHVAFGAMAIATAASIAPLYFALPIVVIAAFLLLRMSESGKIKGDAAIALISTGALAVGVMATSMTTGMNVDIYNYMFGSILTMSESDVVISSVVSVVIIALFILFYHEIFAVTFDESFAKATGTKVSVYNMLIAALTAVTIVIGMRMMGALLISSLIIFPTVTSMRICKSFKRVVISSVIVSIFCFVSGLILSVKVEAPTGASVVIMNMFMLLVFTLIRVILQIPAKNKLHSFKKLLIAIVCVVSASVYCAAMFSGSFVAYEKEKTSVVATTFAPYDFARQITGDCADVEMLLSPGGESHTYEPTPGDIMKIKECDVFVYGGGESEAWVETILDSIDSEVRLVKMMDVVELYEEETDDESHNHGHEHEYDEHVWTSPLNAIRITEAVCEALCTADGENEMAYRRNTAEYINELQLLDESFEELMTLRERDCIIIGDRFPLRYFTERYSLDYFAAFPGCSAQVEANPVTISTLCDKIDKEGIPVVFKVDLSKGEVAETISEQTGAEVETLYSCHVITASDFENGETYISLMKRNLEALRKALI
ncbi:MAG: zinc ABC transporter substrate-binding protein [Clostridia bacterium]|nr:zinc ABC transporter substrate-binding protein [Clostridia bacterium]